MPKASPLGNAPLRPVLFEKGYHDRIINRPGMLENIKRYMAENPLRARIREECPRLLRVAEEGAVLVTPGISRGESLVVSDALDARLPLILLQKEPIGEYWKPPQRRFYACAAGYRNAYSERFCY